MADHPQVASIGEAAYLAVSEHVTYSYAFTCPYCGVADHPELYQPATNEGANDA